MHHIDIHVRSVSSSRDLIDALMSSVGYGLHSEGDGLVSYWKDGRRPAIFFDETGEYGSGALRLGFGVATRQAVDAAAAAVRDCGAQKIEGPGIHPEYGDDYYAVFFEDADGNRFEVVHDGKIA